MLFFSGCTVGPDYHKPEPAIQRQWAEMPGKGLAGAPVEVIRWWTLFQDEELDSLVDRAVGSNLDLQAAEARIRQARAQRGIVSSRALPSVDTTAAYTHQRLSGSVPGQSAGTDQNLFEAGFDAAWELDLFGGVRRSVEAADADIAAARQDRNAVLVTLLGEVSTNYLQLRGAQRRIDIAQKNIKAQQATVALAQGRYQAGLGSSLEVAQAQSLLAATEAGVPALESQARQAIHRLGTLLGAGPGMLLDELSPPQPIPSPPPEVPVGLPSDLLRRRPDVQAAERRLAASTALVGAATAQLFPRFSLTGLLGVRSANLSDFISAASRFYSLGSSLLWPIFDAGRIRAEIRVQNALQEQAFFSYEKTVLTALEDTENAIVAYSKERTARLALVRAVDEARKAAQAANELYKKGLVDFLNVLQSESSLYQLEDRLVSNEQQVSTSLVALFKALGGGWQILPDPAQQAEAGAPAADSPDRTPVAD